MHFQKKTLRRKIADFQNDIGTNIKSYAGLFLRLGWHASGTLRDRDGEGSAAGGRVRYPPESPSIDNANLDHAGIKENYGDALSWSDLFVFGGAAAILQGGGVLFWFATVRYFYFFKSHKYKSIL